MRRIGRMLILIQVWSLAAFGAAGAAAESAGEPEADAAAPSASGMADVGLAVLDYLVAAQRADARVAHADAIARMHAEAAVLARFGLAPPEEAASLEGLKATAAAERDAAKAALEAARAQLAERLPAAALRTLSERSVPVPGPDAEPAADERDEGEGGADGSGEDGSGEDAASAGKPGATEAESPGGARGGVAVLAIVGEDGASDAGGAVARNAVPYPEPLLEGERAMRQACRRAGDAGLLLKAGVGSASALAEARSACLQAELAWIEAQEANLAPLLAGSPESGAKPVGWPELLAMARDRQPALYERWVRHLKADVACPSVSSPAGAGGSPAGAGGAEGAAEQPDGCAIGLPGIRLDNPQPALRVSGNVYLPLKPYAAALGFALEWHAAERRVTLAAGETRLSIRTGSADIEWDGGGAVGMSAAVLPANGQTCVPAEFFYKLFGLDLYWDDDVRAGWLLPAPA